MNVQGKKVICVTYLALWRNIIIIFAFHTGSYVIAIQASCVFNSVTGSWNLFPQRLSTSTDVVYYVSAVFVCFIALFSLRDDLCFTARTVR